MVSEFALRSRTTYAAAAWDWAPLEKDLPRKMRFSDLDGILVLPGGRALVLEGKHADVLKPPRVPAGQWRGLRDLASTGFVTVFVLGGRSAEEIFWLRVLEKDKDSGWMRTTTTDVRRRVREWVQANDANAPSG